jgi:hypothetical protein
MPDWTIVATAGISAASGIGGAALGFLGAIRQGQSDTERLRAQHIEDERRHRQGVYHDLIDHLHAFNRMASEDVMSEAEFAEWEPRFVHLVNGVRLFGGTSVAEAAGELLRSFALFDHYVTFAAQLPGQTFEERLLYAFQPAAENWADAGLALREAMRTDVQPPAV